MRNERISYEAEDVDILPQSRIRSAPGIDKRHDKFQFEQNPMQMSSFEKKLSALEVEERKMATEKYVRGIQGRDGGCFENQQKSDELFSPLNPSDSY
jgi:hypothetical protein